VRDIQAAPAARAVPDGRAYVTVRDVDKKRISVLPEHGWSPSDSNMFYGKEA